MSIDILQDKIRKLKNPSLVDLTLPISELPPHLPKEQGSPAKAYGFFCRQILERLKDTVPGVRFGFTSFVLLGGEGLEELRLCLQLARKLGYYVVLDAPEILSPMMAETAAGTIFGEELFPCDGLILNVYPGTDCIKPFAAYAAKGQKTIFPVIRTSNKSAPEIQDLLTGGRLVHTAAADLMYRFSGETMSKCGYSRVGVLAGGSNAESLRILRTKYPHLFLLIDDIDYSGCNARICASAFDQFGYGAAACAGPTVTTAWKLAGTDGRDYLEQAAAAAERMRKNLLRYTNIL